MMTRRHMLHTVGLALLGGAWVGGCSGLSQLTLTPQQQSEEFTVTDASPEAFAKTQKALYALGWPVTGALAPVDPIPVHTVAARVDRAINIQVRLEPRGSQTVLQTKVTADSGFILNHPLPYYLEAFRTAYGQQGGVTRGQALVGR